MADLVPCFGHCTQCPKGQTLCNLVSLGVKPPSSARTGASSHLASSTETGGLPVPYTDFGPALLLPNLHMYLMLTVHECLWHCLLQSLTAHHVVSPQRPVASAHITRELVRNAAFSAHHSLHCSLHRSPCPRLLNQWQHAQDHQVALVHEEAWGKLLRLPPLEGSWAPVAPLD